MINWRICILGALTTAGLVSVAHSYGPGNPAILDKVPPGLGFAACGTDGKVCKAPAGATAVYVVYGTGSKFATAQGTGDFTCLPKGSVKTPSASTPQDLGVADPVPGVLKTCYMMATVPSPVKGAATPSQTSNPATTTAAAQAPAGAAGLTDAVLKSLTSATVANYTIDQYNQVRDKISLVPPAAVPGFTDQEIHGLGWAFTNDQLLALSASQFNNLQRDWLVGMSKPRLLALLPKLPPTQLFMVLSKSGLLTAAEVQSLSPDQIKSLSTQQFGLLSADIHKALTPSQMAALSSAQVEAGWNNWTGQQMKSFTVAQLAGLTPEKMPGLASLLSGYSAEQIQALSGTQLSGNPVMFGYPWFKNILPKMTAAQISGLSKAAATTLNKSANVSALSDEQSAALKSVLNPPPPPPAGSIAKAGDSEEITRQRKLLANCAIQVEDAKMRADGFKSDLKSQKIKGLAESSQLGKDYSAALKHYYDFKTKKYPPNPDPRFNGFPSDQYDDCAGAQDGFMNYWQQANIDNDQLIREYDASHRTLSADESKIKPQLETCVASLKTLQASNNQANEDSKKIFNTSNPQLTKWGGVNERISSFVKTYSVVYTASNLSDCQKLAADTTVGDEYYKLSGLRSQQKKDDVVAAKAAEDARVAAMKKRDDDAEAARKAQYAAEQKAKADAETANHDPKKLKACIDDVLARRNAVGTRYFAQPTAFDANNKAPYDQWTKEVDAQISGLINSKESTVSSCLLPWPQLDQLENLARRVEAQAAADRAKAEAAAIKLQEERQAKAAAERRRWLAEHPTDIPGACHSACMARHAGAGPKETECERVCAITSKAVKDSLNFIVDATVVRALDEGLGRLGVTKALCEAATGKAGEILAEVQKPLDNLKDKIKETSAAACISAKGSPARCTFVGRFVTAVSDAKACSDTAGSLRTSLEKTSKKVEDKTKLLQKSKANGGQVTKEEENAIKEAAMETTTESAATCESPKASDIIKSVMAPCVDAAAGALWLGAHGGDL